MIQLARQVPGLPAPERQWRVCNGCGEVFAELDLAWPDIGLFIELDGQQHKGQAVYDARRETAVVAATGWFCGRFTWREVVYLPVSTLRRLVDLVQQARRRPVVSGFVHP
jgi:very-short-patch-repair endonuclease